MAGTGTDDLSPSIEELVLSLHSIGAVKVTIFLSDSSQTARILLLGRDVDITGTWTSLFSPPRTKSGNAEHDSKAPMTC